MDVFCAMLKSQNLNSMLSNTGSPVVELLRVAGKVELFGVRIGEWFGKFSRPFGETEMELCFSLRGE